jgi:hypothetical protein
VAQLTSDQPQILGFTSIDPDDLEDYDVEASVKIFQGSAVGQVAATGGARQLIGGDLFLGFAVTRANNSNDGSNSVFDAGTVPGDGTLGSITVPTQRRGQITLKVTQTGTLVGTRADRGVRVYGSTGNDFTDVSSGNSQIGCVVRYVSQASGTPGSGVGNYIVSFESQDMRNS